MADGNVFSNEIQGVIEPFVYELVGTHYCDITEQMCKSLSWLISIILTIADYNGSISAEHGLGSMKAPFISYSQTDTSINLMRRLKKLFDPKGIMNPHKFIL